MSCCLVLSHFHSLLPPLSPLSSLPPDHRESVIKAADREPGSMRNSRLFFFQSTDAEQWLPAFKRVIIQQRVYLHVSPCTCACGIHACVCINYQMSILFSLWSTTHTVLGAHTCWEHTLPHRSNPHLNTVKIILEQHFDKPFSILNFSHGSAL